MMILGAADGDTGLATVLAFLAMAVVVIICVFVFFLPTIIAFRRNHYYKWIIFAINFAAGATVIGYLVALVWAVWPSQTGIADVLVNDPTTNSVAANRTIYSRYGANLQTFRTAQSGKDIHVTRGGLRYGPYMIEEARAYIESSQLSPQDLAWAEGMSCWSPLMEVIEANGRKMPPPPPPS